MKTALVVLVFALAPLVGAQSRDITWSDNGGARVCRSLQVGRGSHGYALHLTAATSGVPCPGYLATTIFKPKHRPMPT